MATNKKKVVAPKSLYKKQALTILVPDWRTIPAGSKITFVEGSNKQIGRVFYLGSEVYILTNKSSSHTSSNNFTSDHLFRMYAGTKVEGANRLASRGIFVVDIIPVEKGFKFEKPVSIGGYGVVFGTDFIKVGCQTVPHTKLYEIVKRVESFKNKKK